MPFFSQIFNSFHLNNTKSNKFSQKIDDQGFKASNHLDTSSQYSGYSDGNSEADINTSRMVKIMTEFHNNKNNNYKNSCINNKGGGGGGSAYSQLEKNYKTELGKEIWSKYSSDVDYTRQATVTEIKDIHVKSKNNNKNKRKKKNGIKKGQRHYVHKDMWSKTRD